MYKCDRYIILLITTFLSLIKLASQDAEFSQYYSAKFKIAPSFAGTAEDGRFTIIIKDQWPELQHAFITYGFAADYFLPALNGGLGAYALQDYSNGTGFVITNAGVQYSYLAELEARWQFRPGLQLSAVNKRIDLNKITFGNQLSFDGKSYEYPENLECSNITNAEAAVSALLYNDNIWLGFNFDHLPLTNHTFSGERITTPVKFLTFGGFLLTMHQGRLLYDRTFFYFSYLFKVQNNNKQLDLGAYLSRKGWEVGLWYRGLPFIKNTYGKFNNSALIIKVGLELDYLAFGYSYDLSLSTSGIFTGGAHEISMVYLFDLTDDLKKKKHKMVPSPRF